MKNLSAWIAAYLILIANPLSAETFTNTNDDENGKSFGQLMSWVFDGEKSPDKIEIETSDQWRTLTDEDESYAVWIGHATYLINNGDINILTDPIFSKRASPIGFAGPKRMIPPVMSMKDLPKIDVVVVSHNHYDHLDMYSLKKLHKINPETIFLVPIGDGKRLKKFQFINTRFDHVDAVNDVVCRQTPVELPQAELETMASELRERGEHHLFTTNAEG